jgi:hypothetical protein
LIIRKNLYPRITNIYCSCDDSIGVHASIHEVSGS